MLVHRPLVAFSWQALRQNRKFLWAALLSLVPVVVGLVMFFNDMATRNEVFTTFRPQYTAVVGTLLLGATVPFVALLLAGGMLADEVEDRTLSYLLVRPIPRRVLYASKAVPVILATAGLAALQAFLFGLTRLAAAFAFGDAPIPYMYDTPPAGPAETIDSALLVLRVMPAAMLACALVGAVLAAVFGLMSLLTTRFHFLANLLLFLAWELPFGRIGGASSYLTSTYWGLSILGSADPTYGHMTSSDANPFVAVAWLVLWVAVWVWAGMKWIPRRGFNITSAAT